MRFLRRTRHAAETLLAHLALVLVPLLPRRFVVNLARALGSLGFLVSAKTRKVAIANLNLAFGDTRSPEEKRRIARDAYRTFALVMLDLFWFSRGTARRVAAFMTLDPSCKALAPGKPAVCVTAHFGNWELAAKAVTKLAGSVVVVAAPISNPTVDRVLNRLRRVGGETVAYKKGAIRAAVAALRQSERVGFVVDQNVKPQDGGKFVNFFGLPVPMSTAPEQLALKMALPIVFVFCVPLENGTYRCYCPPGIVPDRRDPGVSITQQIAARIEEEIRTNPGCWLWMYKRWKFAPPGHSREKYPFYARAIE